VRLVDCSGYIASLLVFLTFYMKDMVPLRVVALFSNVAFLVYGGALHLWPVILLHGALIPINIWRLTAEFRTTETAKAAKAAPPSSPSRSRPIA
jgi:CRP/FNR family cyclic AMP-dependent transcriptional regulator